MVVAGAPGRKGALNSCSRLCNGPVNVPVPVPVPEMKRQDTSREQIPSGRTAKVEVVRRSYCLRIGNGNGNEIREGDHSDS